MPVQGASVETSFVGSSGFIMLFIYVYLWPMLFPYQMTFMLFGSNTTDVTPSIFPYQMTFMLFGSNTTDVTPSIFPYQVMFVSFRRSTTGATGEAAGANPSEAPTVFVW
jgi:hypothetical protein